MCKYIVVAYDVLNLSTAVNLMFLLLYHPIPCKYIVFDLVCTNSM